MPRQVGSSVTKGLNFISNQLKQINFELLQNVESLSYPYEFTEIYEFVLHI